MSIEKKLFKELREILSKMVEYISILEREGSHDLEEEINTIQENADFFQFKCNSYLRSILSMKEWEKIK